MIVINLENLVLKRKSKKKQEINPILTIIKIILIKKKRRKTKRIQIKGKMETKL